MPHGGLALANSLATFLECGLLLFLLQRRLGGLQSGKLLDGTRIALLGSLAMMLLVMLWLQFHPPLGKSLIVLSSVGLGAVVYATMLWIQRTPELFFIWGSLIQRARRIFETRTG
jgi:putative peptidoglycan lipid II flippase